MDSFTFKLLHEVAQLLFAHVRPGELNVDEGIDGANEQSDREQQLIEVATRRIFPHFLALPTGDSDPRLLTAIEKTFDVHRCI